MKAVPTSAWRQLDESHSFYDTHIKRTKCKCGNLPTLFWRNTREGFFKGGEGKFKCDCGIEGKPSITSNGSSCAWNTAVAEL